MISGWGWLYFVAGVLAQAAIATVMTSGFTAPEAQGVFLGYLVFCTLLWFAVLTIARAKGLDEARWLAWTFVIPLPFLIVGPTIVAWVSGIIPLLFLIFARRYRPPAEPTQTCPHCRSAIPETATVCRYCTRDIQTVAAPLR